MLWKDNGMKNPKLEANQLSRSRPAGRVRAKKFRGASVIQASRVRLFKA